MTDTQVLPNPSEPRKVAVEWVGSKLDAAGLPRVLRHHDEWLRHDGTVWLALEHTQVREDVYQFTEHCCYLKDVGDGVVEPRPWAPNARKVTDVLDAVLGLVHQPADRCAGTWLDDRADTTRYVPCLNGLVDVVTGDLHPHDRAYFNRHVLPTEYDPAAPPPTEWLKFLHGAFDDDTQSVELLAEWFGYVVSGRCDLHKMLALIGASRSGKGVIMRTLGLLVGKRNSAGISLSDLATNFGLQTAINATSVTIGDARDTGGRDIKRVVETLLSITGQDEIQVDRKNRTPWSGTLGARITMASNEVPAFVDASTAIGSRMLFLHLPNGHVGREDRELESRIGAELGGVLRWALEGLTRLTARGKFISPDRSAGIVAQFESAASPISEWLDECADTGIEHQVEQQEAYNCYRAWSERQGAVAASKRGFTQQLQAVLPHYAVARIGGRGEQVRAYTGLALNAAGAAMNYWSRG